MPMLAMSHPTTGSIDHDLGALEPSIVHRLADHTRPDILANVGHQVVHVASAWRTHHDPAVTTARAAFPSVQECSC